MAVQVHTSVPRRLPPRRSSSASRRWLVGTILCAALGASQVATFVATAGRTSSSPARGHARTQLLAWPWEAQGNPRADRAYSAWIEAFPKAEGAKEWYGQKSDPAAIKERFLSFEKLVGEAIALPAIEKEPILLQRDPDALRESWEYLKNLETAETKGQASEIMLKNPKLLTVPAFEYQRTKPSLDSLASTSAVIDFLRPLGPAGLTIAIFGGFTLMLLILRPILYGVGGGPSLVALITSPFSGMLPSLSRPYEIFESFGINLSSLVVLIPLYQVGRAIIGKVEESRAQQSAN